MLLTLLLALAAQQLLPPGNVLQRRDWLLRLEALAARHLADPWLRLMVFLALLILAGALVLEELRDWAFALPALLAGALVLLWSLGDEDYHTAVERAEAFTPEGSGADVSGAGELWVPPEDSVEKTDTARTAIVYGGYGRWFAPLFFFALAGPLGAAAYRAVAVLARAGRGREYLVVLAWLDWAPARLLALTFALTGDFVAVLQRLRDSGLLDGRAAAALLSGAAEAALGDERGARAVAGLLTRSSGIWLAAGCLLLLA